MNYPSHRSGQIFIIVLILLFVVTLLFVSLYSRLGIFIKSGWSTITNDQATGLADAGVDWAVRQLTATSGSFANGTTSLTNLGTGVVDVTVAGSGTTRSVTSIAYVPSKTNTQAKRTATTQVTVKTTDYTFPYAVHGLQSSGTAVSLSGSTVTGDVHSNSAISCSSTTVTGNTEYFSGSPPSCGTPQSSTNKLGPMTDIQNWRNAAAASTQSCSCSYTISSTVTIGPKKYTCTLIIGDNANIALTGPIWITGDLIVNAPGTRPSLYIDPSLGSCGTVIVVEGKVNLGDSLINIYGTGTSPIGYPLIVTETTLSPAIKLTSSSSSGTSLTGIFYASMGDITSGVTPIVNGAVVGSTVALTGATVTYGGTSNLQPAHFCGSSSSWIVKRGSYKISK